MNVKISLLVICVEAIIYLLLYNLHDCTFKSEHNFWQFCNQPILYLTVKLKLRHNFSQFTHRFKIGILKG